MLLNCVPGCVPSIIYIKVPIETTSITTNRKKTAIFLLLSFSEVSNRSPSIQKVKSLNIRKTRMIRNARITSRYLAPGKKKARYNGSVASKSMIPKKLKIYFFEGKESCKQVFEYDEWQRQVGRKPLQALQNGKQNT